MLPKDSCDASPSASELPSCVVPGGFFGGGGNVISSAQTAAQDRNTGKSIIADGDVAVWQVIETGLQAKQGTEARRMAERLSAKMDNGSMVTPGEIGALQSANARAKQAEAQSQKAAQSDSLLEQVRQTVAQRTNRNAAPALASNMTGDAVSGTVMGGTHAVVNSSTGHTGTTRDAGLATRSAQGYNDSTDAGETAGKLSRENLIGKTFVWRSYCTYGVGCQ